MGECFAAVMLVLSTWNVISHHRPTLVPVSSCCLHWLLVRLHLNDHARVGHQSAAALLLSFTAIVDVVPSHDHRSLVAAMPLEPPPPVPAPLPMMIVPAFLWMVELLWWAQLATRVRRPCAWALRGLMRRQLWLPEASRSVLLQARVGNGKRIVSAASAALSGPFCFGSSCALGLVSRAHYHQ
jgi:hypothetical protein